MSEDDYEELPASSGPLVHMAAGAAAGVLEHTFMFPFDVLKTRLQGIQPVADARYRGIFHGLRTMIAKEGVGSLFSGIKAMVFGAGPAHALYFSVYEHSKMIFGVDQQAEQHFPIQTAAAACCATVAHDAFMNPFEVVKQRLQMAHSPYTGMIQCARSVWATEGWLAFYRSIGAQLTMNIPFHSIHLVTYETLRKLLNPSGAYNPPAHLLAGAGAGTLAAAMTTPFDVVKTLLNTQELSNHGGARLYGMRSAIQTIYSTSGLMGFGKGMSARVLFIAPSAAISWSVYEFFKYFLTA